MDEPLVRASEVGQYIYCARSWWLAQVQGVTTRHQGALAAGTAGYRRHGHQVILARTLKRWAVGLALAAMGIVLLIFVIMLAILLVR